MKVTAATDIGGRSQQEDSLSVEMVGSTLIAIVCDGMGGHLGGAKASRKVCDRLSTLRTPRQEDIRQLGAELNSEGGSRKPGTTLLHMSVTCDDGGQEVRISWVGDSLAYILIPGRAPQRLTRSHGAGHRLYNCIGGGEGDPHMDVLLMRYPKVLGTRIVLMSDGVTDATKPSTRWKSAQDAVNAALDADTRDNATAIMVEF